MSKTEIISQVECKAIKWHKAHLAVLKLVKGIYKAFEQKDYKKLQKQKKTLAQSWSAKLLLVKNTHSQTLKAQALKAIFTQLQGQPQYVLTINLESEIKDVKMRQILPFLLQVALEKIALLVKVITYGDQILIFSQEKSLLTHYQEILTKWLCCWIQLPEVSISHTQRDGFDFAGFSIRHSQKGDRIKTFIIPSAQTIHTHYRDLANCCDKYQGAKQIDLIKNLNLLIKKWCTEYLLYPCKSVAQKLDFLITKKLYKWAINRHPRKGKQWVMNKYWRLVEGGRKQFACGEISLSLHF